MVEGRGGEEEEDRRGRWFQHHREESVGKAAGKGVPGVRDR